MFFDNEQIKTLSQILHISEEETANILGIDRKLNIQEKVMRKKKECLGEQNDARRKMLEREWRALSAEWVERLGSAYEGIFGYTHCHPDEKRQMFRSWLNLCNTWEKVRIAFVYAEPPDKDTAFEKILSLSSDEESLKKLFDLSPKLGWKEKVLRRLAIIKFG